MAVTVAKNYLYKLCLSKSAFKTRLQNVIFLIAEWVVPKALNYNCIFILAKALKLILDLHLKFCVMFFIEILELNFTLYFTLI